MKYEWRKHEKYLYKVKEQPSLITIPQQNYIAIKGKGNPNRADFSERIGVLYSLAYQVKKGYKLLSASNLNYQDFTVFPLEGVWSSSNENDALDKDSFIYTIMIKQPDFITKEMFEEAFDITTHKKPHSFLKETFFHTCEDGLCVQILHKGSYDNEPASFAKMKELINDSGYKRRNEFHREIYLTNATRTAPEKRQTILRYQIG